jgi:two-component system OmpR family response regulator
VPTNAKPAPHRILVVDDEASISDLVATALRFEGFEVSTAATGNEALDAVESLRPDLVVLDVMLPDVDGFEVARRLTAKGKTVPVLFLTARDATDDKVLGLNVGGDDYVTKPFSLAELVARVHAVLRRSNGNGHGTRVSFSDLEMDDDTREVFRAGRLIELTATEYRLLHYLLVNARKVLSRAQLLDHVWDYDFGGDSGVLETYISYLRKKIDVDGPPLIHTVRGVGYTVRLANRPVAAVASSADAAPAAENAD